MATQFEKENLSILSGIGDTISQFKILFEEEIVKNEEYRNTMDLAFSSISEKMDTQINLLTAISSNIKTITDSSIFREEQREGFNLGFDRLLDKIRKPKEKEESESSQKIPKDSLKFVKESGESLSELGKGLHEIAGGLIKISVGFIAFNPVVSSMAILATKGLVEVVDIFSKIEKENVEKLNDTSGALHDMAMGFLKLAGVFAIISFIPFNYGNIFEFTSAVLLVTAMFTGLAIGIDFVYKKLNLKGDGLNGLANSMIYLGAGIASIGAALSLISFLPIDYGKVALFTLAIAGVTAAFVVIAGLADIFAGDLKKLSIEMLFLSAAITVSGLALTAISFMPIDLMKVGVFAISLGLTGLTFMLLGKALSNIILGSVAVLAMSASLFLFSLSLEKLMSINIEWSKLGEIAISLLGASLTFAAIGNPVTLPFIISGVAAVAGIGLALQSIAKGLIDWNKIVESNIPVEEIGKKIESFLYAIQGPFAAIGKSKDGNTSLMNSVFGVDFGQNHVEAGINAVQNIGSAMISMVEGIISWKSILDSNINVTEVGEDLAAFVTAIQKPFAAVGKSKDGDTSLLKAVSGFDFSQNHVEVGINAVTNIGEAMSSITEGIIAWTSKEMAPVKSYTFSNQNGSWTGPEAVAREAAAVILAFQQPLSEIGKTSEGSSSWLKSVIGTDFSQTDVEKGIEISSRIGNIIMGLGTGVKNFVETTKDLDPTTVAKNVGALLMAMPNAIASPEAMKIWDMFEDDIEDNKSLVILGFLTNDILLPLTKDADKFKQIEKSLAGMAKSYSGIAESSGTIKDNINGVNMELVSKLNDMFYNAGEKFMKVYLDNKNDFDFFEKLGETLEGVSEGVGNIANVFGGESENNNQNTGTGNKDPRINISNEQTEKLLAQLIDINRVTQEELKTNNSLLSSIARNTRESL